MIRGTIRHPYRDYKKEGFDFHAIFLEIKAARARRDTTFITNYCKGKRLEPKTLENRFAQWQSAGEPATHQIGVADGLSSDRGGHNRAFSLDDENAFAEYIRNEFIEHHIPFTLGDVQLLALERWNAAHPHDLRDAGPAFKACHSYCFNLLKRHRISYRRVGHHRSPKTPAGEATREQFIVEVRQALVEFGSEFVLNLDETFWRVVDVVLATWANRGDPSPFIEHQGSVKAGVTAAMIVTASGIKLPTIVIAKGKKPSTLDKFQLGRFGKQVVGKLSSKAWMNSKKLVEIIRETIGPYLRGRRGALILDCVRSHTKRIVKEELAKWKIKPLYVPAGTTGTLQPLDVGIFGPMKSHVRSEWRKKRLQNLSYKPTWADAMKVLHESLEMVNTTTIRNAWKRTLSIANNPTSKNYPSSINNPAPPRQPGITLGERVHRPSGHTWNQQQEEAAASPQQQSSSESKEPISEIEKKKEEVAAVLAAFPLQQPKWVSTSSHADTAELINTQRYGKKEKIAK